LYGAMSEIMEQVAHRPYPPPGGPWLMHQRWHDLLFAHWPVPVERLRAVVPGALAIDTFDGTAWLAVVPFRMSDVRPRLVPPLPWLSAFPELNVRTYVSVGGAPGVYFFSLDAGNPVAVAVARTLLHLRYFRAEMRVEPEGDGIRYRSRRTHAGAPAASLVARYRPTGPAEEPAPGSLEYWLTERYRLYAVSARGRVTRIEIHHPPWPLQPAVAELETNTMAASLGIALSSPPALLHFARRQDVVAWGPAGP
jgi:uncharacterized protein YqjF (DUF2071 family)